MSNKFDEYAEHYRAIIASWDGITGNSNIPTWNELSELQREAIEGLGYGPLSYPHYVEEYKEWYAHPNATYNLYHFFERLQDQNFGGHGSEDIEYEFEQRRERQLLRAVVDAAQEVVRDGHECIHELDRDYGKSYEVGQKAMQALIDALAALDVKE